MMRFKTLMMLALAVGACAGSRAGAQTISYSYVTDQTLYQASSGGAAITVNLYLQETLTGGATSLINASNGLNGGAVAVQAVTQTATTLTSISPNTSSIGSGGFDTGGGTVTPYTNSGSLTSSQNYTQVTGTAAALTVNTGFTPASGPQAVNILNNSPGGGTTTLQVLLGTLTITPGTLAPGQSAWDVYKISSFGSATGPQLAQDFGSGYTVTYPDGSGNVYNLDSTNNVAFGGGATYTGADNTIATFTVAVPEPSSMFLCGLAAFSGAIGYYRRRRAARAVQQPRAEELPAE
jgi:hypothetical protein